jgi:hypothetical protein
MARSPRPTRPPDDAFLEINGRKWRRSDPRVAPSLRQELVNELMSARRAVRTAAHEVERRAARRRVNDTKVALGERGRPWWLDASPADLEQRIDAAIRALLRSRRKGATICPSEVARIVDGHSWRRLLSTVREQAARLARTGQIVILRNRRPASGDLTKGVLRYKLAATSLDHGKNRGVDARLDRLTSQNADTGPARPLDGETPP